MESLLSLVILFHWQTANLAQTSAEAEGKNSDGKERALPKKSKGNSVSSAGKAGEGGKATSGSGNDGPSQRCMLYQSNS